MRCPPGLVFDDVYQRCEWPGAGSPNVGHRLGSLRDKKSEQINQTTVKTGKLKVKQFRVVSNTKSPVNATSTTMRTASTATTTQSNNVTKRAEP